MATLTMTPPVGITGQMAGIGDGQGPKTAIRQVTLTGALAAGDVLKGPKIQSGAIIVRVTRIGGPAGNLGTDSAPTAFNAAPFTPYVVPKNEQVNFVATAAGGVANDVISLVVDYLPRNT
jgi:hypothetical protein